MPSRKTRSPPAFASTIDDLAAPPSTHCRRNETGATHSPAGATILVQGVRPGNHEFRQNSMEVGQDFEPIGV
ncbi:MAG: hypothetical protein D6741_01525 [Planctomycetota bacterium]|nr:MAG: hypothetical protein D6741_01525 [Planctomycetota bacterium]